MIDEFEKSITTKYRSKLWSKFVAAIKKYKLIEPNDHICVCISGGKDSMLMARLFMQLHKHSDFEFKVEYLVMNPGYNEINLQTIKNNLEILSIPAAIVETDIFEIANSQLKSPCFLCAKMRRGALYNFAKKMGCNKIALGHHFDDVIETTLLSMFYGSEIKTMMPKLHSDNFEGLELIRPLYLIKESAVLAWKKYNELTFINCACRFTENCSIVDDGTSKRKEMKNLVDNLRKINPSIDNNIFTSMNNINLNCVLGTKKDGKYTSFLDNYDNK